MRTGQAKLACSTPRSPSGSCHQCPGSRLSVASRRWANFHLAARNGQTATMSCLVKRGAKLFYPVKRRIEYGVRDAMGQASQQRPSVVSLELHLDAEFPI